MKKKRSKTRQYTIDKWVRLAPYHQDMLNELVKAHGAKSESDLIRHLIEWEWEFIHVWDETKGE